MAKKWYEIVPSTYPQAGFQVEDTDGIKYIYAGLDTGYMMRLENSNAWDGTGIAQVVETGDFYPSNNPWDITRIRYVKLSSERISEDADVAITAYVDGATSGTSLTVSPLDSGSANLSGLTQAANLLGNTHRYKFSVTTSTTAEGHRPVGWGYRFRTERKDK